MFYSVRHHTRFTYETPVTESIMEVRMQPRSEGSQRCLHFGLSTAPASRIMMYQDHDGNIVHHFDIPGRHAKLTLTAEALVEYTPPSDVPARLGHGAWTELEALAATGERWEALNPSPFTGATAPLQEFASQIRLERGDDPLATLRRLNEEIYTKFEYVPQSTRVDSPIDHALESRQGVCQDFAHIMIALTRQIGIPCRYVSGYLFHAEGALDRSADGATHAWVEALLPTLGWVGFDPTNNLVGGDRHIRVAIGRDYTDVAPTRGVYKGVTAVKSELAVSVRVGPAQATAMGEIPPFVPWMSRDASVPVAKEPASQQQQ